MPSSGTISILFGAVAISFSSVFVKLADTDPTASAFYRVLFGGLALLIVSLARRERIRPQGRAWWLLIGAAVAFALDLTFWHISIKYVGPGLATILSNFQVFFMAAIGLLVFSERLTLRLGIAIPLSLVGLLMLVGPDWSRLGPDYQLGVVFGLLTAVCYTAYILQIRKAQSLGRGMSPVAVMTVVTIVSTLILAGEVPLMGEHLAIVNLKTWAALLALGVFCQCLGWIAISSGLPKMPASRVGLVLLLQPTLSFIWDILFFARPTGLIDGLGAVVAIAAIYLGLTSRRV